MMALQLPLLLRVHLVYVVFLLDVAGIQSFDVCPPAFVQSKVVMERVKLA